MYIEWKLKYMDRREDAKLKNAKLSQVSCPKDYLTTSLFEAIMH